MIALEIEDLIGIPFLNGGRDPKVGLDCLGLVIEIHKRRNITLPDFSIDANDKDMIFKMVCLQKMHEQWEKIDDPEVGCVILFRNSCGPFVNHLAVSLGGVEFIHTLERTGGSVIERLDHPFWRNKIDGHYKWKS